MLIRMHNQTVELKFPKGAAHIERQMKRQGWYERAMLEDALGRIPVGCAVDVGAYCGTHTLWFAKMMGMRVVAFEPVQEQYIYLQQNVERNKPYRMPVDIVNVALGAKKGTATWQRHNEENTGTDTIQQVKDGTIEVVPLDWYNLFDVSLLKIDVEGMELEVLDGALKTIQKWHPLIYVEAPETIHEIRPLLGGLGYDEFGEFNATPTFGFSWTGS